ncbi:MAG: methylated-DNA--[protein]-cysteine S-methyltransferase [Planctomycetes bacterium]|nr:methylated-DNA--[protein]-cysteine S-methyltransferase [Planctomycetota bacterium]
MPADFFLCTVSAGGWPPLFVSASGLHLLGISPRNPRHPPAGVLPWPRSGWHSRLAADLPRFLAGRPVDWNYVPLNRPLVSPFTWAVLSELRRIPRGSTLSYGDIAVRLRRRNLKASPRSVGGACARNPWPLVVPCHRVLAKNGVGGFGWGVKYKKKLLALEGAPIP